jgi:hypothetical protein
MIPVNIKRYDRVIALIVVVLLVCICVITTTHVIKEISCYIDYVSFDFKSYGKEIHFEIKFK